MPFFLAGLTKCSICHETIQKGEEFVATMAFPITGPDDKFWNFYDAFMHRRCFDSHPLKYELRDHVRRFASPGNLAILYFLEDLDELLEQNDNPE
jgi:hypothetical protein